MHTRHFSAGLARGEGIIDESGRFSARASTARGAIYKVVIEALFFIRFIVFCYTRYRWPRRIGRWATVPPNRPINEAAGSLVAAEGTVTAKHWLDQIAEMAEVLGPGGIMEVVEEEIIHKCVRRGRVCD